MLTGVKAALAATLVLIPVAQAPEVARRAMRVTCEKADDGNCVIAKRDLAGIIGASEALFQQVEELRRDVEAMRQRCPTKPGEGGPAEWSRQERRT